MIYTSYVTYMHVLYMHMHIKTTYAINAFINKSSSII